MRLLHTRTLTLQQFVNKRPPYAILSHTWEEQEVSFKDIQDLELARKLKGFAKIQNAAKIARSLYYDWIWIDTCNIDKSSSAELSETINSMYKYYGKSAICIAYLCDVDAGIDDQHRQFKASKWFTRGWTLQELIAPGVIQFYDKAWTCIGTKAELKTVIHEACEVDEYVLRTGRIFRISVARRMYWAAKRQTTREEDMAYCLFGFFKVNMPLLYGEGLENAFLRLQKEILKDSDDQSLFAWRAYRAFGTSSLLACNPSDFDLCRDVSAVPNLLKKRNLAVSTSEGLQMKLLAAYRQSQRYIILDCQVGSRLNTYPCIEDVKWPETPGITVCFADRGRTADARGLDYDAIDRREALEVSQFDADGFHDPYKGVLSDLQMEFISLERFGAKEYSLAVPGRFGSDYRLYIEPAAEPEAAPILFVEATGLGLWDAATQMLHCGNPGAEHVFVELEYKSARFIARIGHPEWMSGQLVPMSDLPSTIRDGFSRLYVEHAEDSSFWHQCRPMLGSPLRIRRSSDAQGPIWIISAKEKVYAAEEVV